jgi:hypothetical protein
VLRVEALERRDRHSFHHRRKRVAAVACEVYAAGALVQEAVAGVWEAGVVLWGLVG